MRYGGRPPIGIPANYDVARDGRFLINVDLSRADDVAPITIIQHWRP